MRASSQIPILLCLAALAAPISDNARAQAAKRDGTADLIGAPAAAEEQASPAESLPPDPRTGEKDYEQAKALMAAVDDVLKNAADVRSGGAKLPSRKDFILPPLWSETREDRDQKVKALLDAALSIVTDAPVVEIQKKVEDLRRNIRELEDLNANLKEKQVTAPKDAALAGILTDTVGSLDAGIAENEKRIAANRAAIAAAKGEITAALRAAGVDLDPDQVDLLLDSVLSGDLVRLIAAFNAAKAIDGQLARMIAATGDNMTAARRYFAMHAALFAMLVRAQDMAISKIDQTYIPKLEAVIADVAAARTKTANLLKADNRPDQLRALEANRDSQKIADEAAKAYRRYLQQQREQLVKARLKASHDLRIADNTYETVEASVQLRNLMRDSAASFEAIQNLETPSFEQIFKNDELRREFENLTRKLDAPTS